jgi:hypothetical protein
MATLDIVIISAGSYAVYHESANCFDRGEAACRGGSHDVAEQGGFGSAEFSRVSEMELMTEVK